MAPSHQANSIPGMIVRSLILIAGFVGIFFLLNGWYVKSTPKATSKRVERLKTLPTQRTAGFIQKDSLMSLLGTLEKKEGMDGWLNRPVVRPATIRPSLLSL